MRQGSLSFPDYLVVFMDSLLNIRTLLSLHKSGDRLLFYKYQNSTIISLFNLHLNLDHLPLPFYCYPLMLSAQGYRGCELGHCRGVGSREGGRQTQEGVFLAPPQSKWAGSHWAPQPHPRLRSQFSLFPDLRSCTGSEPQFLHL